MEYVPDDGDSKNYFFTCWIFRHYVLYFTFCVSPKALDRRRTLEINNIYEKLPKKSWRTGQHLKNFKYLHYIILPTPKSLPLLLSQM